LLGHRAYDQKIIFRVGTTGAIKEVKELIAASSRTAHGNSAGGGMARTLTKRTREGALYTRPPDVEAQIDRVLAADLTSLRGVVAITDRKSPDYLRSETLVHLLRDAIRTGDGNRLNAMLPALLRRCEAILQVKVSQQLPNAEQLREDILSEFAELVASDGAGERPDEMDFYECRFNLAFYAFRISAMHREQRDYELTFSTSDEPDDDESDADLQTGGKLSNLFRVPDQEDDVFRDQLRTAIERLPKKERDAVVYVHGMGYDEESVDTNKTTAATLCNCTGRTIRNRLTSASKKLKRFTED